MWILIGLGSVALFVFAIVKGLRDARARGSAPDPLSTLAAKVAAQPSLAPLLAIARAQDVVALSQRVGALRGQWDVLLDELRVLGDALPRPLYDTLVSRSPSPSAHLLRGAHGLAWAWAARGSGRADTVTDDAEALFVARLEAAKADLLAASVDVDDPTPWALMIAVSMGLGDLKSARAAFQRATQLEPAHLGAHRFLGNALNQKWLGESHDDALAFARGRRQALGPTHPVAAFAVVAAHFFRTEYDCVFEPRRVEALAWLRSPEVKAELADLWDSSLATADLGAHASEVLSMTSALLFLAEDQRRCATALRRLGEPEDLSAWSFVDPSAGARQAFEAARAWSSR